MNNIIVYKGDGPCPACDKVLAQLRKAGIAYVVNEHTGDMFHIAHALGVRGRPILVWYSVGDGDAVKNIIDGIRSLQHA